MINLRYHIISIVAVFLALGIGLALGSTFVDSVLVNESEYQVNEFETEREEAVRQKQEAVEAKDAAIVAMQEIESEATRRAEQHRTELAAERAAASEQADALMEQAEREAATTDTLLGTIEAVMPRVLLGAP